MRASDLPPTVAARREAIAERFARAPGVLCCLDFDGTLAPIVDDPTDAAMSPPCRSVVTDLADLDSVTVAVVSGRAIDDLRERVGVDGVVYAGNHGLELQRDDRTEVHPEAEASERVIGAVCDRLERRTASIPGCRVEDKGVTATVHYRGVPDDSVADVVAAVDDAVSDVDGDLTVTEGKQIREIRPAVDWDKGRVVASLAADAGEDWETVYVGDDTTDEDAFDVVEPEGLGVHVGERAGTHASVRLPDQSRVATFLTLIRRHQNPL